ncbi:metal ABC transporter substrate-binding protein [Lentilitoribacter sp. Alg239-R112]|uniref:metal ABC transporter substrate-binding protein n=1 Tax=Lentilitoribacter sp. Alg239-R112 TaxID=2305987 RepID=UPI0013A69B2F|nr:metal ABC transporter substrate-binding protein [Lentilitoribacter sp. Alg239-R112]
MLKLLVISLFFAITTLQSASAAKLQVVTTFTVFADMAKNIVKDRADVISITKPGAEIHNYQPTPGDIRRAQRADLILWNGLNLELWFEKFFENLSDVPSVILTDGIDPISIGEGPYNGKPNPHAWMSPKNGVIYVENMTKALITHDSVNADFYRQNADIYIAKIMAVSAPITKTISDIDENRRWLVTSEGAFSYLARDFGLKELFIWPINADQQGTPQQVRKVIDKVRELDIPAVFSESTVSANPAKTIAKETDAKYGGVLYVDSLSNENGPVPTYIDLINVTVQTIAKGLSKSDG